MITTYIIKEKLILFILSYEKIIILDENIPRGRDYLKEKKAFKYACDLPELLL